MIAGVRHTAFLKLHKLAGGTAAELTEALMEVLTSTGEMTPAQIAQKLVGMAGDGAAVISGQYSGVQAQLRMNHAPHVVWSHCAGAFPHILC